MKSNRASNTAKVIAASTILLASERHQSDLVAPGAAELCEIFLSGSISDRILAASARHPLTRCFWRWVERLTLPGIIFHYWHRKRWIEDRCRVAIADGFERVVVIGAGFDTLGIRLSREFDRLDVIELDHPATQELKRSSLARNEMALSENFRFSTIDLTHEALPSGDAKPTVFILEGVLMYLPEMDVCRLFRGLLQSQSDRIRVIFSFMTRWPDGGSGFRPHSGLIERWLALNKEPFTWAIEPEAVADFLAGNDFRLSEMALTREFSNTPLGTLEGENLVVCEPKLPPQPDLIPRPRDRMAMAALMW